MAQTLLWTVLFVPYSSQASYLEQIRLRSLIFSPEFQVVSTQQETPVKSSSGSAETRADNSETKRCSKSLHQLVETGFI